MLSTKQTKQTDYEFFCNEIQQCLDNIAKYVALGQYGQVCFWQEQQVYWEDNAQRYVDVVGDWE